MTGEPTKILVVDDEPPIRRLLRTSLRSQGFHVIEAATGRQALSEIETQVPDLVLLDLGLPDIQGDQIIRMIRGGGNPVPVLVLSSRADEKGKVDALDLGADDYITKPFGADELFARIRAALRHRLQQQGETPVFRSGDLKIDLVRRIVCVRDEDVKLSPKEYDILRMLVTHAGKVLTHRMLMNEVWDGETDVQYLRIYIRQLRQKIEANPEQPAHILTETGVGYRLRMD